MGSDTRDAERNPLLPTAIAEFLRPFIQCQGARDGARGPIRLFTRRTKQDVNGVADDLRQRSLVCEHDIGHGDEIVVEERAKHVGFERLNQRREAGDIGKQRCDLAALSAQVERFGVAGEPLSQIRREVTRE